MPFYNRMKNAPTRSRKLEQSTFKKGLRHAIFSTSGSKYIGEWKNNQKNGKGSDFSLKTGELFQGDFKNNLRHGFGVLTRFCPKTCSFKLLYRGTFTNGKQAGYGLRVYYKTGSCYCGNFVHGKRNGYGQMWYADGSFYDGDWLNGNRHGKGLLVKPDGNRYEGSWEHDKKHGRGEFYFLKTGQLQEGIWENDVPCVNTICDIPYRQSCIKPTLFSIPKICLVDIDEVLKLQEERVLKNLTEMCLQDLETEESL